MLRAMVTYLLENGQIKTTLARAKEVAPLTEKMITLSKKNDLAAYRQALASRTLRLCRVAIEAIHTTFPTAEVEELCLDQEALLPLHSDTLAQRHALEVAQAFDHPMFRYARQFAAADVILVGAPYWEYQFPALLRCYVEHISVSGLTFAYGEDGRPHGLCKGDRLFYLTTAGGPILDRNCGFDYLKTLLGNMMDFKKMDYVAAECTDVIGYPVEEELQKAEEQVRAQIQSWR